MDVQITKDGTKAEVTIVGEDHTFCNLLKEILQKDPDIEYASYNISHPYISEPQIIVEVKKGKDPKKVLQKAAETIITENKEILDLFKKALSK